jgi:hypothetical protein
MNLGGINFTGGSYNFSPEYIGMYPSTFMTVRGVIESKDSWSTDWDEDNIIDFLKNTLLIKDVLSGTVNFTFKTLPEFTTNDNSTSLWSKTIKLILTNTLDATITWDPKIIWIRPPVYSSSEIIVVMELNIGASGLTNAYAYTV